MEPGSKTDGQHPSKLEKVTWSESDIESAAPLGAFLLKKELI